MNTLQETYRQIKRNLISYNKEKFFKDIIPQSFKNNALMDVSTMNKYINGRMSKEIIRYYSDQGNQAAIKRHLSEGPQPLIPRLKRRRVECLIEVQEKILQLPSIMENGELSGSLEEAKHDPAEFFYRLFYYCIAVEMRFLKGQKSGKDEAEKHLKSFEEQILLPYGISSEDGKAIIKSLAENGDQNPYLLFEAAELEMAEGELAADQDQAASHYEMAFRYYTMSAAQGHGPAQWSLGYLYQSDPEKTWPIAAIRKTDENDRISIALEYFQRAAEKNCYRTLHSFGKRSEVMDMKTNSEERRKMPKKQDGEIMKKQECYGIYHYACVLEKELKDLRESGNLPGNFIELAKEMLSHYERASKMENYQASYRCALYYGHLADEITMAKEEEDFGWIRKDEKAAIDFFKKAVKSDADDPMVELTKRRLVQYILDGYECFSRQDMMRAKGWIGDWKRELEEETARDEEAQEKIRLIEMWESDESLG